MGGTEGRYPATGCQSPKPLSVRTGVCNTYPDAFADYPLGDTIKEYYKTWYGYDVTDNELEEMLLY